MTARILVAEDSEDVRSLLCTLLTRGGYEVVEACDGQQAIDLFFEVEPSLVILDISMPVIDGWQVLSRIRDAAQTPVIVLTAHTTEMEKVRGLRAGADDYLTKPFGRQELLARVERRLRDAQPNKVRRAYQDANLTVDFAQCTVHVGEELAPLTPLEFKMLAAFVSRPGELLSREDLLQAVWASTEGVAPGQVKLYVAYLRRKLQEAGGHGDWIETSRGFGYRYNPPA